MVADYLSDELAYTLGDYISDWAEKNLGQDFMNNKFRDGSAFAAPPEQQPKDQSPIRIIIEIER